MRNDETIAAIGTAPGEGGLSIVRISGPDSLAIADQIIRCRPPKPSDRASHTIVHGFVREDGRDVDEVLVLIMRRPGSYTGEDVVEIQGHGGGVSARRVLRCVLAAGARPAEPGEFTLRAFLNGRMDLLQAEAVQDLVRARSNRSAAAALEQLEGRLSQEINGLYERLTDLTAEAEACLDFPEDELPTPALDSIARNIKEAKELAGSLTATWNEGRILREGVLVVISGAANVGKSTLLNTLSGHPRSIVSTVPGTTRDYIEQDIVLGGIPMRLVDTAGLRDTDCEIEAEGMRRTLQNIEKADVQLYILDSSKPIDATQIRHLNSMQPERTLVILNKTDLGGQVCPDALSTFRCVKMSLATGAGVSDLKTKLLDMIEAAEKSGAPPHAVISERHYILLIKAIREMEAALSMIESDNGADLLDFAAIHLRGATEAVGSIHGKCVTEDLLQSIFSKFCIGK